MFRMNVQNVLRRLQSRLSVACVVHWSRCQSLPGPDGPIPPRHAGAALKRPWSGGACTHALVESPTPHSQQSSDPNCSVAIERAKFLKKYEKRKGLFWNTNILDFQILQGSVATQLRWGGSLYNGSIGNFLRNLTVKELWQSVFIWRSYDQKTKWLFFLEHGVYTGMCSWLLLLSYCGNITSYT